MSTWTSKAVLLAGLIGLAGCEGGFPGVSRGTPAQSQITVADASVVIAGPAGFCVDPASTRVERDVPFVMLGSCAAISRNRRAPQPNVRAVLTAAVAPLPEGGGFDGAATEELASFFRSPPGRAMLSWTGDADTVDVLESFSEGDVFYMHTRDTSPGPVARLDDDQWRAYFGLNGRVVSASVLDFGESALDRDVGLAVLRGFTNRIQTQTLAAQNAPVAAPATAAVATAPTLDPLGALRRMGLFRKILGQSQ